ncbi:MAG TPA: hypothetical protein VL547_05060 [Dinghuibacter sp.]|uniref:serine acetyltransferase n=1 Tax=Dinghuibacter sp. TaxID=2024697 RepID=UPI002CFDE678|nr:hypothetical protein [Dinghuibacter sp.]HTJ11366.1 hypothetical protein [Dinghuibacter sp.]
MAYLFSDWSANPGNFRIRLLLVAFRLATLAQRNRVLLLLLLPHLILYRFWTEWIFGFELPWRLVAGPGLTVHHGHAMVVNKGSVLGASVTLRHCTTIGNKMLKDGTYSGCPVIGSHVDIGAHACIVGPVVIGDHAVIGAGAVVVKDVAPRTVVAGNPAKVIGTV